MAPRLTGQVIVIDNGGFDVLSAGYELHLVKYPIKTELGSVHKASLPRRS